MFSHQPLSTIIIHQSTIHSPISTIINQHYLSISARSHCWPFRTTDHYLPLLIIISPSCDFHFAIFDHHFTLTITSHDLPFVGYYWHEPSMFWASFTILNHRPTNKKGLERHFVNTGALTDRTNDVYQLVVNHRLAEDNQRWARNIWIPMGTYGHDSLEIYGLAEVNLWVRYLDTSPTIKPR